MCSDSARSCSSFSAPRTPISMLWFGAARIQEKSGGRTPGPGGINIARAGKGDVLPLQTTLMRGAGGDRRSGCEPRACYSHVICCRAIFIPSEGEVLFLATTGGQLAQPSCAGHIHDCGLWPAGLLLGWLSGWLASRLAGWLVGWLLVCLLGALVG